MFSVGARTVRVLRHVGTSAWRTPATALNAARRASGAAMLSRVGTPLPGTKRSLVPARFVSSSESPSDYSWLRDERGEIYVSRQTGESVDTRRALTATSRSLPIFVGRENTITRMASRAVRSYVSDGMTLQNFGLGALVHTFGAGKSFTPEHFAARLQADDATWKAVVGALSEFSEPERRKASEYLYAMGVSVHKIKQDFCPEVDVSALHDTFGEVPKKPLYVDIVVPNSESNVVEDTLSKAAGKLESLARKHAPVAYEKYREESSTIARLRRILELFLDEEKQPVVVCIDEITNLGEYDNFQKLRGAWCDMLSDAAKDKWPAPLSVFFSGRTPVDIISHMNTSSSRPSPYSFERIPLVPLQPQHVLTLTQSLNLPDLLVADDVEEDERSAIVQQFATSVCHETRGIPRAIQVVLHFFAAVQSEPFRDETHVNDVVQHVVTEIATNKLLRD